MTDLAGFDIHDNGYFGYDDLPHRSEHWDLYLMTLNYYGQEIDLTGAYTTKIFCITDKVWITLSVDLLNANYLDLYGISLPVISRDALIAYKKILARPVDLLDLEFLEQ